MNHPKMLLLAGRLVVAMETMAQDVKSMATYVKDISCSVSYLLNERREKENTFVVPCDETDNPTSVTSGQLEQAAGTSSSYIADPFYGENPYGDIAHLIIVPYENSDILSSDSISYINGAIKIDEWAEVQADDETHDVHNMYGNGRNNVKEIKSETPLEFEEVDQPCDLHTTVSHSVEQMSPSDLLETIEHASAQIRKEIQQVVTSSNSAFNNAGTAFVSRIPEAETSVATTPQMETTEDTSMMHQSLRSEKRSYKCSLCGRSFNKTAHLIRHMRTHTAEKPYGCTVCGKAFSAKWALTVHVRTHTGEKPYKCTLCGKSFPHRSTLTFHMHSHTGEKPYICDVCGKECRQKTHLTVHMRMHTGEKPYKCNLCGRAFRHRNRFNQHMITHCGQLPN